MEDKQKAIVDIGRGASISMGKGASMSVGGDINNRGEFKAWDAEINVSGDINNEGKFLINDPEKIKQILVDIAKTAKNATEIGTQVIRRIFGG